MPGVSNRAQFAEKAAAKQVGGGGLSDRDRLELAQARARKAQIPEPTAISPRGQFVNVELEAQQEEIRKREELKKRQEDILPIAEETGVFEERPEQVELDIKKKIYTGPEGLDFKAIPVAGTIAGTIGDMISKKLGILPNEDPLILTPEGQREIMKNEIQKEVVEKTEEQISILGVMTESVGLTKLPLGIGDAVARFTKTPSEDIETLRVEISELDSLASQMTDAAAQGELGNPAEVLRKLDKIDRIMIEKEQQIKTLLIYSAELKSDPEEINLIELEILKVRDTIFEGKQRAAEGALVTPTDSHLYYTLKDIKEKKKINSPLPKQ